MEMVRTTYILRNGEWERDEFKNMKKGDSFKLFDGPDPVVWRGESVFVAACEPYQNKDGIWSVEAAGEENGTD